MPRAPRAPVFPVPRPGAAALWAGRSVGLLGGSFNPAHTGHRHVACLALSRLGLDAVWLMVSPQNPLKSAAEMAPLGERLQSAQRMARHPRIVATPIETALGTRYTADTLAALRRAFPRTHFVWLMGADNLSQISRWQRWETIFAGAPVAVFARPPYSLKSLGSKAAQRFRRFRIGAGQARGLKRATPPAWVFLPIPLHAASATAIRRRRARAAALFERNGR